MDNEEIKEKLRRKEDDAVLEWQRARDRYHKIGDAYTEAAKELEVAFKRMSDLIIAKSALFNIFEEKKSDET